MNEVKWGGFVYVLTIAVRVYCEETGAILLTPNKLQYTYFPFPSTSTVLKFKVRAGHNAHVLLSGEPTDENPTYEIFLGGWMNTRSALRLNHTRPDVAAASTVGILNAGELRGFWVNCSQGFVGIGREGELIPFLKWTNLMPFKVKYFGVRTGWGATGEWIIDDSNVTYARVDLYDFHIGHPGIVSVDVLSNSNTTPFLIWKVHNKTFSEDDFDPTGGYYATKALLKKNGEWQAKLVISNLSLEDTQEEILLTARNRSRLGATAYHVFLYAFNATSNYTDDLSANEANESSAIDSSSLTDGPIFWSTVSTLGSSNSNTNSNNIFRIISHGKTTTSMKVLLKTPNVMERTTPTQILTQSSLRTSPSTASTLTTPKTMRTVTIPNNIQNQTIALPRNITKPITDPKYTKIPSTSKPKETSEHISYNTTALNKMYTTSTKPRRFISGTKQYTTAQKFSTKIAKSPAVTGMPARTTALSDLPSRIPQCSDYVSRAKYVGTIGVLVLVLALITALLAYIMIKHKNMTGYWGFTAKCQTPIPMANLYDDDNGCLIQPLASINNP